MTAKVKITTKVEFSEKARNRLLRLSRLLRADAKRKTGVMFDMTTFCSTGEDDEPGVNCGTRACALGLAALSGEFKAEGLRYKVAPNDWGFARKTIEFTYRGDNMFDDEMAIAAKVFDIPETVAVWLFGGDASKHEEGAKAELEMAEIIEKAAKGDIPQDIVAELMSDG